MNILYEDEQLLLINKPAGRLVLPGRNAPEISLLEELSARLGRRLFVVHRIDRETSGVLAFAKDAATHRLMNHIFETRAVLKRYLAAVQGRWDAPSSLRQPLGPFGSGRWGVRPDGKPSRTDVEPIEHFGDRATLVQAEPRTGRRHQIRVHLFTAGHPVLGDPLYGKPPGGSLRAPRLMLHSWRLEFRLRGRRFRAEAPAPPDLESFLTKLREAPDCAWRRWLSRG